VIHEDHWLAEPRPRQFAPAFAFWQDQREMPKHGKDRSADPRRRARIGVIAAHVAVAVVAAAALAGCASSDSAARDAAERDYRRLTGTWQLTRAIVDGQPVPEAQARATILITEGNTFRFPQASGVGTHPAGSFTINPSTVPNQVDSVAIGGVNAGQVTLGIYEILDDTHKRACWGPPGGPRPTGFDSAPGSRRILQYWEKIGPVPAADRR
jgi:uncharacterized protein (TIGR03067 family)